MVAPPPHPVVYKYDDRYKDKEKNTLRLMVDVPPQLPARTCAFDECESEIDPPAPMVHHEADAHAVVHKVRMNAAQRRQLRMAKRKTQDLAVRGYEAFHMLPVGSATIAQVRMSSAGICGYADYDHGSSLECKHNVLRARS